VALGIKLADAVLNSITQVLLARWMGAWNFGTYSYAIAWSGSLGIVAGLGFPNAALRFVPEYLARQDWGRLRGLIEQSRRFTVLSSGVIALGALVWILHADWRDRTYALMPMAIAVAMVWPQTWLNLQLETARGLGQIAIAYGPTLVLRPILVVLGCALWPTGGGTLAATAGLGVMGGSLVGLVIGQWHLIRRRLPAALTQVAPHVELRHWFGVALPLLFLDSSFLVLNQTDTISLGLLVGDREVGLYSAAVVTARWVNVMLASVNAIAAPLFSSLYAQDDRAGLQAMVSAAAGWIFFPALGMAIALGVGAESVLGWFGPEFGAAKWALWPLILGQLVNVGSGSVGYLLMMTGHHLDCARVVSVCALVNLLLNLLLIPEWGIAGAAISTAVSMMLWNLWLYRLVVRYLDVRPSILDAIARALTHRRDPSPP
jgi:O-antigen/teichoic acid export membrane protein